MAAELRWILLGLSLVLLAGIWWWGSRRSSQAAGNDELRESAAGRAADGVPTLDPYPGEPGHRAQGEPKARDWGVPPFEPLSIRTGDYEGVPVLDVPMMVHASPMELGEFDRTHEVIPTLRAVPEDSAAALFADSTDSTDSAHAAHSAHSAHLAEAVNLSDSAGVAEPVPPSPSLRPAATSIEENSGRFAAAAPQPPNTAQLQRIVTLRVCCADDGRWSGTQLMNALESHGLSFGRYQVFHRKHVDGRSMFCVASLIEPGTFDIASMPESEFRGVTLFAVMPGPVDPVDTFDELLATARGLAEQLSGNVQDTKSMALSAQRALTMREELVRFQAQLRQG